MSEVWDKDARIASGWVHDWVSTVHRSVFNSERPINGPLIVVEAPAVKGLTVYAARYENFRYFGAWTERSGIFIGWTRKLRPNREMQLWS
jgi:hypothetical protein